MTDLQLYGFSVSPHVRTARMAFHEKSIALDFREIALDELGTDAYARINPFRKMPALVHGELCLYETPALMTYADAIGRGPSLEPSDAAARAQMWKFVGVAQNHLYPVGAMQLYFHSVLARVFGMTPDASVAASAAVRTAEHLDVLESGLRPGVLHLAGNGLSHADLYCGAMVDYVARTREGRAMIATRPRVSAWLGALRGRASFVDTFAEMLRGTDQA